MVTFDSVKVLQVPKVEPCVSHAVSGICHTWPQAAPVPSPSLLTVSCRGRERIRGQNSPGTLRTVDDDVKLTSQINPELENSDLNLTLFAWHQIACSAFAGSGGRPFSSQSHHRARVPLAGQSHHRMGTVIVHEMPQALVIVHSDSVCFMVFAKNPKHSMGLGYENGG